MPNYEPYIRYIAKTKHFIDDRVVANDCRILYIIGGKGFFECNNKVYDLYENVLIYYPAGVPYRIHSYEDLFFYTVNFDFTREFSHLGVMAPKSEKSFNRDNVLHYNADISEIFSDVIYVKEAYETGRDIESIYCENQKPDKKQHIEDLYMEIVLSKLSRSETANPVQVPLCETIKEMIDKNLLLNIKEIAEILSYHPYYLNDVFSKNMGITLHKYIMNRRLCKARELLLITQLSIEEISHICGFCSQSHMSAAFKSVYKITPGKLRRLA